jgi:hypothetical protein
MRMAAALALSLAATAAAAQARPAITSAQVVLLESGVHEPTFVLYSDRTVIFRASGKAKPPTGYLTTRVIDRQYEALMAAVDPQALSRLADSYVAGGTNAPPTVLMVWLDGRQKTISVFGRLRDGETRSKLPPEFVRAYDAIAGFIAPAGNWTPPSFEVMLRPAAQSSGAPAAWPKGMPPSEWFKLEARLNRLIIPGSKFAEVQRVVASLRPGQAVLLQDRYWVVSYRLPFPREDQWEDTLRALAAPPPAAAAPGGEPRVVLLVGGGRQGPAHSPSFALYADGVVIFAPRDNRLESPSGYYSARLPQPRYEALLMNIAPEALLNLDEKYDVIRGTDPLVYEIHVWVDGRRKTVSVAGHLWSSPGRPESDGRARVPPEFLRAYDTMAKYSGAGTPWAPPSIAVTLSLHDALRGQPRPWPRGWPSLDSAYVSKGGLYHLTLPGSELGNVRRFAEQVDAARGGVRIGEHNYVMGYRFPFPHEDTWAR